MIRQSEDEIQRTLLIQTLADALIFRDMVIGNREPAREATIWGDGYVDGTTDAVGRQVEAFGLNMKYIDQQARLEHRIWREEQKKKEGG